MLKYLNDFSKQCRRSSIVCWPLSCHCKLSLFCRHQDDILRISMKDIIFHWIKHIFQFTKWQTEVKNKCCISIIQNYGLDVVNSIKFYLYCKKVSAKYLTYLFVKIKLNKSAYIYAKSFVFWKCCITDQINIPVSYLSLMQKLNVLEK